MLNSKAFWHLVGCHNSVLPTRWPYAIHYTMAMLQRLGPLPHQTMAHYAIHYTMAMLQRLETLNHAQTVPIIN